VRLAVFTNQFPSAVSTFFARDLCALAAGGIEADVYAFYPHDARLWRYVPAELGPAVLPRERVHHLRPVELARAAVPWPPRRALRFGRDALGLARAAARYGPLPVAKTAYVAAEAWTWAARARRAAARGRRYDHVLAYWGNYAASCAWLFQRLVDPGMPFSMFAHARVDLYRHPAYLAEKFLYADNVFLVCEYNRRHVAERYARIWPRIAGKVRVHHLGLDLEAFAFDPGGRPPARLLAVTRFERHKGVHVAVRALALLRARGLGATLDLVGDGEEGPALRALAAGLGLGDAVRFRGWLAPDAVRDEMRRATLLVHAPLADDAMPTVVKEALALGTPVVASRSAGIPEMLDDGRCGALVAPGDAGALAGEIATLLGDAGRRAAYARAGRRHAERTYDMWANGRRLAQLLRATPRRDAR
jgi:glycosyltransferase involved in cell wall biosynthesis